MRAMILAAGLGTRLKPFTDHHPKALAMVNDKSLLQRNVEYLMSYGITEIIVNVHHFADQIIETINENKGWGANITISDETHEVLETGGGLLHAAHYFEDEENWWVMNADILTNLDFKSSGISSLFSINSFIISAIFSPFLPFLSKISLSKVKV